MRWGAVLLLACGAGPAAAQTFGSPTHFTEQGGEAVYRGICAGCHMPDGRGAVGAGTYPSLVADERLAVAGSAIAIVLHGQRGMPGFGRTMSDQQVADVVGYERTHFGNAYSDAPVAGDVLALR